MGVAAIKMRGEREKERRNYSSMVQIMAGRLSGPTAITVMTTWRDMIVTALRENHRQRQPRKHCRERASERAGCDGVGRCRPRRGRGYNHLFVSMGRSSQTKSFSQTNCGAFGEHTAQSSGPRRPGTHHRKASGSTQLTGRTAWRTPWTGLESPGIPRPIVMTTNHEYEYQ